MMWAWGLLAEMDRCEFALDLMWVRGEEGSEGRKRRFWQEFNRKEAAFSRSTRFFCLRIHRTDAYRAFNKRKR